MVLFNKKKEESSVPPAPPAPPSPPAPPGISNPSLNTTSKSNISENNLNSIPKLSTPPQPGGSLDSIKQEVSSSTNVVSNNKIEQTKPDVSGNDNSEEFSEDLFDFSDLKIPEFDEEEKRQNNYQSRGQENNSNSFSSNQQRQANNHNSYQFDEETAPDVVDSKEDHMGDLNFVSNKQVTSKGPHMENFFVTTSQFKTLLEIIDSVKFKVKEASDRHLKLLDFKAEEDVEYENLRKDFQFIEDKLYEVDSLIFEK